MIDQIPFRQVSDGPSGHPRYACLFHYLTTEQEAVDYDFYEMYRLALLRAKPLGGKLLNNSEFSHGIVFETWDLPALQSRILAATKPRPSLIDS